MPQASSARPVVAINALAVNATNAGTRTMLTELIPALGRVAPHLELLLICHPGNRPLYDPALQSIVVELRDDQLARRLVLDLFRVPRMVRRKADVLVTPTSVGPLRTAMPQVAIVTAHLALPSCQRAVLPDRLPRAKAAYLGWPFRRYLRNAAAVLGISDFVADGIVDELGIERGKVTSMPLGVAAPPGGASLEGRGNDVLFVGTLYPYKDGATAIRAFAAARDRLPSDSRLIIVGGDHAGQAEVLGRLAHSCGVDHVVEIRGSVSSEELERLFRTAGVLLMPSLCEGFGLPVAEAMAYGLPVIAADATSLPGVAGGAARLVEPRDVPGFAAALEEVLNDPEVRRSMATAGLQRAAELTWDEAARRLASAIDAALLTARPREGVE